MEKDREFIIIANLKYEIIIRLFYWNTSRTPSDVLTNICSVCERIEDLQHGFIQRATKIQCCAPVRSVNRFYCHVTITFSEVRESLGESKYLILTSFQGQ